MKIHDQILVDEKDLKKSSELGRQLEDLAEDLPRIAETERVEKEVLWTLYEQQRKWLKLGYPLADSKELQAKIWNQEEKVKFHRKNHNEEWVKLTGEQRHLTLKVKESILFFLEREKTNLLTRRVVNVLGTSPRVFDRGNRGEETINYIQFESNLKVIDRALDDLIELINFVRGSGDQISIQGILDHVKKFEVQFNKIDYKKMDVEEVDEKTFKAWKAEKLL